MQKLLRITRKFSICHIKDLSFTCLVLYFDCSQVIVQLTERDVR